MLFISAVPVMFKGCTPRLMRRVPSTMVIAFQNNGITVSTHLCLIKIFPLSAVSMYIISTVHLGGYLL